MQRYGGAEQQRELKVKSGKRAMSKTRRIAVFLVGGVIVVLVAALAFMIVRNCCAPPSSFELTSTVIVVTNEAVMTALGGTEAVGLEATFTAQAARIATVVATRTPPAASETAISH
jgi:hypothetical protein